MNERAALASARQGGSLCKPKPRVESTLPVANRTGSCTGEAELDSEVLLPTETGFSLAYPSTLRGFYESVQHNHTRCGSSSARQLPASRTRTSVSPEDTYGITMSSPEPLRILATAHRRNRLIIPAPEKSDFAFDKGEQDRLEQAQADAEEVCDLALAVARAMLDRTLAAASPSGVSLDFQGHLTVVRTPSAVWNKALSVVWGNAMQGGKPPEKPDRAGSFSRKPLKRHLFYSHMLRNGPQVFATQTGCRCQSPLPVILFAGPEPHRAGARQAQGPVATGRGAHPREVLDHHRPPARALQPRQVPQSHPQRRVCVRLNQKYSRGALLQSFSTRLASISGAQDSCPSGPHSFSSGKSVPHPDLAPYRVLRAGNSQV